MLLVSCALDLDYVDNAVMTQQLVASAMDVS
uniref:Uncharacterized protein n=1 Tax=Arundo donax TaxID=35708 RepID=A0A0A8ZFU5_ARUDO